MPTTKTPRIVTVKKRAPRKATATRAKPAKVAPAFTSFIDPEKRVALIAKAAYYRAEKRGFSPEHETADWLAAESEVDAKLMRAKSPPRG